MVRNRKIDKIFKKIKPFLKPSMFISFGIAWMVTNGWAYVLLGIGLRFDISWAKVVGYSYLGVLWLPITPEKLITIPLGILIHKLLFNKKITINGGNFNEH